MECQWDSTKTARLTNSNGYAKIDICLISEIHITQESYLKLRGYEVHHRTHPNNTTRGVSVVTLKKHIYHYEEIKYQIE